MKKLITFSLILGIIVLVFTYYFNKTDVSITENNEYFIVKYPVTGGIAEYWINKKAKVAEDKQSVQFISNIRFNGIDVTSVPYIYGASGLVSTSIGRIGLNWESHIEQNDSEKAVITFSNGKNDSTINLEFSEEVPMMKITTNIIMQEESQAMNMNYVLWQSIGGKHNLKNRVVVPSGEDKFYVINGQANGIHYFPSNEYWVLRMGEEGTEYENITVGFMTTSEKYLSNLTGIPGRFPYPKNWRPWAMGQDLYLNANNQFNSTFDEVPYDLDKITNNVYGIYQEDEAGLGYAWCDYSTQTEHLKKGERFYNEVYFWVGEDKWHGDYGLNEDDNYRFMVDKYQNKLD